VDAAWGGYLAALFRAADGGLRDREAMRREFTAFPSEATHAAVAALGAADSITVDPHKLGYLPYGAGAFVCRDHRAMALLAEDADYVFGAGEDEEYFARFRQLGRYVLEGSKSGALAAAVYVTHRVLPLDHAHFGRLAGESLRSAEAFTARAARFAADMAAEIRVRVPYVPDCNLVCLALNPAGNRDVATMNRFVGRLHDALRCDPDRPLQSHEFFGSTTTLRPAALGAAEFARVLAELDLDPATLGPDGEDGDRLLILRHTLMNPFLVDDANGVSYIDRYFEFLATTVRGLRAAAGPGRAA
jgi:hypothetical protein